jgi:mannosyltransferase
MKSPSVDNSRVGHPPRSRRWEYGLVLAIGAATSSVYLGRSFFLDETVSTTLANASWHRFTQVVTQREANMALYYLILRAWTHLGNGEATVRTLSVLASLGALFLVILLTRRLFNRRTALICGLLFAVDPLVVELAQDARGYALSVLLVTASSLLFVNGVRFSGGRVTWAAYVLTSALAAYVNFWAALVPLGHAASLAFLPAGSVPWRRWLSSAVALLVLLVPLGLLIRSTDNAGTNWAAGTTAGHLFSAVRDHVPHLLIDGVVVAVLAIVVGIVAVLRHRAGWTAVVDQWPIMFTVCWMVVPVAALVLLSFAYKPLFVLRYLYVYFPPLLMLIAMGLARLSPRTAVAGLAVLVALSGVGLWRWYSVGPGEDWRGAVTYVADESTPGDGVMIFAPFMRIPFEWYLNQHPAIQQQLHAVYPGLAWGVDPLRFDFVVKIDQADVARGAHGYMRVWLILSGAQPYPQEEQAVKNGLESDGLVAVSTQNFTGVQIVAFAHRPGP